jgi:hypothetical protein
MPPWPLRGLLAPAPTGPKTTRSVADGIPTGTVGTRSSQIPRIGSYTLSGLTALEELKLDGRNITEAGLSHLSGLKALRDLDIPGCRTTDLSP